MLFSVITKNSEWEISTKKLVTFKTWNGVKDEEIQFYGSSLKNSSFRGWGCMKNQYIGGELTKKADLDSLQILEGAWQKRRGDTHYEFLEELSYWHKYPKQITL